MIKTRFLRFIIGLKPEKQVVVILMVIIMFIVPWLKIILSNDSTDRKEALKKCEDAKESAIKVSQEREVRLQNKFDSLLNKAINDKEETIAELRKMWNKDQIIHSTIKSK